MSNFLKQVAIVSAAYWVGLFYDNLTDAVGMWAAFAIAVVALIVVYRFFDRWFVERP